MNYKELLEKNQYIKTMYDYAFSSVESEILNLDKFKLDFHLDSEERFRKLYKDLYTQRKILSEMEKIYPQEKDLYVLRGKLREVSKLVFKVMKEEFHYLQE